LDQKILNLDSAQLAELKMSIPLELSIYPFNFKLATNAKIHGFTKANNLPFGALASLYLSDIHKVSGELNGSLNLDGTLKAPNLSGNLDVSKASYNYLPLGIKIRNLSFSINANDHLIKISNFIASDSKKNIMHGSGQINFHD